MIGLGCTKKAKETWREAVHRIASRFGLEDETLAIYDRLVAEGEDTAHAAWQALYEWDLLDPVDAMEFIGGNTVN